MRRSKVVIGMTLAIAVLSGIVMQAEASKTEVNVDKKAAPEGNGQTVRFATVPNSSPELILIVEDARVNVKRVPNSTEIIVNSNCPRNWHVEGRVIRQCGFATERRGTGLMADALGSRAIVNGQVYVLPGGRMSGLQMGKDGVVVGGQKIEPLKGSDIPGTCSGPDIVELQVPENFAGGLKIGSSGNSEIQVSSWKDGPFEVTLLGNSSLTAGKLDAVAKTVLDNRGKGKAEVGDVSTKVFVANIQGTGQVVVKRGSADMSNATISGTGSISLKGKFNKMQKDAGQGTINITE
ncbi:MAG: hypothetical protein K2W95_16520 [Candidatus Obscuribacterales bacterium]|nr:hypothetical protein [Candidatus Obscuribacterales bacterium]